jgi:hypothetical protein
MLGIARRRAEAAKPTEAAAAATLPPAPPAVAPGRAARPAMHFDIAPEPGAAPMLMRLMAFRRERAAAGPDAFDRLAAMVKAERAREGIVRVRLAH